MTLMRFKKKNGLPKTKWVIACLAHQIPFLMDFCTSKINLFTPKKPVRSTEVQWSNREVSLGLNNT